MTTSPSPTDPDPTRTPVRVVTLGVAVLASVSNFWIYGGVRAWSEEFGLGWRSAGGAMFFAAMIAGGLGLTGALFVRAIIAISHHRRFSRFERGQCIHCGYAVRTGACPECGLLAGPPVVRPESSMVAALPIIAAVVACLLGAGVAEWLIQADEADFRAEVAAGTLPANANGFVFRERAWPNRSSTLIYNPATGDFSATD